MKLREKPKLYRISVSEDCALYSCGGAGIGKEKAKLPFKKVFWVNQYPVPWASRRLEDREKGANKLACCCRLFPALKATTCPLQVLLTPHSSGLFHLL